MINVLKINCGLLPTIIAENENDKHNRVLCVLDYIGDPSYESGWLDSSAWATNRKTVQHNLNQVPALTKVLAKVTKGANSGYVYEGIGYPQAQLQSQSKPYGSVFYFYDERTVTVVLPEKRIDGSVGAVCVGKKNRISYS